MIPPVVASPPALCVSRPPSLYSHRMRIFRHRLREHTAPYAQQLQRVTALRSLQFPELRLVQLDSGRRGHAHAPHAHASHPCSGGRPRCCSPAGKLEALAMLLKKLRSERRRVLIVSQMVLMLDILEMFLNFHFLTYIRIDENANSEQRQVRRTSASPTVRPGAQRCAHSVLSPLPNRGRLGISGSGLDSLCSPVGTGKAPTALR